MINILYSGNNKVFKGILLGTLSIIKHCSEPITIYLATADFTELNKSFVPISTQQCAFLDEILKTANPQSTAKIIDTTKVFKQSINDKNLKNCYTPYAMNRLLIDLLDLPDKLLYIDSDVMACDDISKLFNIDITDFEFAAALDYMGKFWIARDYFNSGVMLINRQKALDTNLFAKCRQLVNTKWFKMPDQSALYRSKTAIKFLDGKFNEQRMPKDDTVVKHFNKGIRWTPFFHIYNIKQWQFDKVHKKLKIFCFDDIFDKYSAMLATHSDLILGE